MLVLSNLISENLYQTITNSQFPDSDWIKDESVKYVVADNSELAQKILQGNEFGFNYVEDEKGNLINVEPIETPVEVLKERKVEEINEKFNAELSLGLPVTFYGGYSVTYCYDFTSKAKINENFDEVKFDFIDFKLGLVSAPQLQTVEVDYFQGTQRRIKTESAETFKDIIVPHLRAMYNYLDIYRLTLIDWINSPDMPVSYMENNVYWGCTIPDFALAEFEYNALFNNAVAKMENLGISYTFRL